MMMKRWFWKVLALILMSAAGFAQAPSTSRISDHWVLCDVTVNGVPAQLKVVNGELARLKVLATDRIYGVTPVVRNGQSTVVLFELTEDQLTGAGKMRQLEALPAPLGSRVEFGNAAVPITVAITGVKAIPSSGSQTDAPCSRCCVRCDGVEACACEVKMDCGHCCCTSAVCGPCIWGDGVANCSVPGR